MWRLPLLLLAAAAWAQQPGSIAFPTYLEGLEALAEGDYAAAEGHFTDCITSDVAHARYHAARGVARVLLGKGKDALPDFDEVLRLDPKQEDAQVWRPWARTDRSKYPVLILDDECDAYRGCVWGMRTPGPYTSEEAAAESRLRAARFFVHRAKGERQLGPLLLQRASHQYDAKQYAEALYNLEHLLAHQPEDVNLLLCKGNCLVALGDWYGARTVLTQVLTLQPDDARTYLNRALVEAKLGDARRARADLEIAAKTLPQEAESRRAEVAEALDGLGGQNPGDTGAHLAALRGAAGDLSTPWDRLVELAMAVHRSTNAWWEDPDETWQEEVRAAREEEREPDEARRAAPTGRECPTDATPFLAFGTSSHQPGDDQAAARALRVALALEEARIRLRGTSFVGAGDGVLHADDCRTTISARWQLSEVLIRLDRREEAIALRDALAQLRERLAPWEFGDSD